MVCWFVYGGLSWFLVDVEGPSLPTISITSTGQGLVCVWIEKASKEGIVYFLLSLVCEYVFLGGSFWPWPPLSDELQCGNPHKPFSPNLLTIWIFEHSNRMGSRTSTLPLHTSDLRCTRILFISIGFPFNFLLTKCKRRICGLSLLFTYLDCIASEYIFNHFLNIFAFSQTLQVACRKNYKTFTQCLLICHTNCFISTTIIWVSYRNWVQKEVGLS